MNGDDEELGPPSVKLLCSELNDVVNWERFGTYLNLENEIRKIRADYILYGVDRCKLELYHLWLERNVEASWSLICNALEKTGNVTLGSKLRQKYAPVLCEKAACVSSNPSSRLPITNQQDHSRAVGSHSTLISVRKNVLRGFSKVQEEYLCLVQNVKTSLKKSCTAIDLYDALLGLKVVDRLIDELQFDRIFSKLIEQCDFLRFSPLVTVSIALTEPYPKIKKRLKRKFKRYDKKLERFKSSTKIQSLVTRIHERRDVTSDILVEMKLEPFLGHASIQSFDELIKVVFRNKYDSLLKMTVHDGCLLVKWYSLISAKNEIIHNSENAKQFLKAVGVIYLHVDNTVVFQKEDTEIRIDSINIALSSVVKNGSIEAFEFFLYAFHDHISNVAVRENIQRLQIDCASLLHIACSFGHHNVVKTLVNLNLPVARSTRKNQLTPLMVACSNGLVPAVKLLLENSTEEINYRGPHGETALHISCHNCHSEVIRCLLKCHQLNINVADSNSVTPLMITVGLGKRKITRQLLLSKADPNCTKTDGDTPLHIASSLGYCSIARDLLRFKADPQKSKIDGWTPLMVAIPGNQIKMVELLLRSGADPCAQTKIDGDSALQIASWNNCVEIVKILLSKGANPDAAKIDGWTALIAASLQGHYEIVQNLLESDAEINVRASDGVTPIYVASQEGHSNVVSLLISWNADIQLSKKEKETGISTSPLMIACQNGHIKIVQLLLQAKANPNEQNESGATPLIISSYHGHARIISLLLAKGANPFIRDSQGQTVLDVAQNDACRKLLLDVGLKDTSTTTEPLQKQTRALQNAKNLTTRLVGYVFKRMKKVISSRN